MNNRVIIIIIAAVAVVGLIGGGAYYAVKLKVAKEKADEQISADKVVASLNERVVEQQEIVREQQEQMVEQIDIDPVENLPEPNPFKANTNPFAGKYKNPFK